MGGALVGLCPYMVVVQGDDVAVHRIFRGPKEAVEEEMRWRAGGGGRGGAGGGGGEGDEADLHPLARLRLQREKAQRRKALLAKLTSGGQNAADAAAQLYEDQMKDDEDERAGGGIAARLKQPPPILTKAVRIIVSDWKELVARGVRGAGVGSGLTRAGELELMGAAVELGKVSVVKRILGNLDDGNEPKQDKPKLKVKRDGGPDQAEDAEDDLDADDDQDEESGQAGPPDKAALARGSQALALRVARGELSKADAERQQRKLEQERELYLDRLRRGHGRAVTCVVISASRVYTGSADNTVRVWDWRNGMVVGELVGHRGTVTCMALGS